MVLEMIGTFSPSCPHGFGYPAIVSLKIFLKKTKQTAFLVSKGRLIYLSSMLSVRKSKSLWLESVQDFFIKLGMKPHTHLVKINIFLLKNVTFRPTKIINRANKNWVHSKFPKKLFHKSWSPSPIFFTEFFFERFNQF